MEEGSVAKDRLQGVTDRGSDVEELSQDRKKGTSENRRERQTLPLHQVPQTKPETREDFRPLVLSELPAREQAGHCRDAPSECNAMIFRLSQKLARKIKIAPKATLRPMSRQEAQGCFEAARAASLTRIRIGNVHLLW